MKKRVLLLFGIIAGSLPSFGQVLVNKVWDAFCATPDTIDVVQTIIDPSGRLVMTGNTKSSTQQNNALTVVRNADGTTAWGQSFNGASNGSDYGTSLAFDASGNIYVGGATYSAATSSLDYLVLKYSSSGSLLWSATYNGPGNNYDVVSGIVVNATGEVFVTGASKGTGNFANLDYATIKYNASGVQQWVARYNYMSLPDVPCGIALDNSGNIFVAGGSANSITGSDIFVIKYNSVGVQAASYRHAVSSGNGWDKATALSIDASGNVFVTGSVYQINTTCDMRTIKLNNSLALQWSGTYDGENRDDCANSLALDGSGNVCITGFTAKIAGGKDFTTIKYDATGNELWVRRQASPVSWHNGEARRVRADNAGSFFVTGEMDCNGNKDFLALKYDANGNKQWEQYFNGTGNGTDEAYDLNLSGDAIYVSGKTVTTSGDQYGTVKYERLEPSITTGTFQGHPYILNEVTVRFAPDPGVLNYSVINDPDIQFGSVADFVSAATILEMNAKLRVDVTKWRMAKIFPDLQTTDTISISRLGDNVRIPSFWAAFRIFPQGIADTVVADSLNRMQPTIWYAEVTPVAEMTAGANDPFYVTQQGSLHATPTYSNAHINIELAWDIAVGEQFVRVGVFDSGIDQANDDLNNGKVAGGYDFTTNSSLSSPYDPVGHGTSCAGIIGAYRNNGIGIAGIAGGDGTVNNPGVSLYDMRIFDSQSHLTSLNMVNLAIVNGARSQSAGGYEMHVMANSWKTDNTSYLLRDAVDFAHVNGVIFVASRGNDGSTAARFPACYYDPCVISVGSSSTDGNYQDGSVGDNYSSDYGMQMDLIAPGTSQIVYTTEAATNSYHNFNGTSAASPHVSGVAALMCSAHDLPYPAWTNLAPEDVEQLIQRTATDVTANPASGGYDDYSGFGRLNAGNALVAVSSPYKIHHYSDAVGATSLSIVPTLVASQTQIVFVDNYQNISPGVYIADVYKVTHTLNFNDIGPNETILGVWTRSSSSFGVLGSNPLFANMDCNIVSYSSTQIVLETYDYHFTTVVTTGQPCNLWLPTSFPAGTQVAATIYTYDASAVGIGNNAAGGMLLDPFPNPADNSLNIGFNINDAQNVKIELFDVSGRLVDAEVEERYMAGYHQVAMQTAALAEGMYIVRMTTEKGILQKKIIIQHEN
jgi:hypothetical protein